METQVRTVVRAEIACFGEEKKFIDLLCMYIFMGFGKVKWLPSSAFVLILHNAIGFIAASLPNASRVHRL